MKKKNTGLIVFYILLIVVIGLLVTSFARGAGEGHYKDYSEIVKDFTSENVESFSISESGKITVHTKPSEEHPEGMVLSNWFLRRIEDYVPDGLAVIGAKTGYVSQAGSCAASIARATASARSSPQKKSAKLPRVPFMTLARTSPAT